MKSKLEIYALCVCFASVISLVISLAIGSYSIIEISAPSLTMNSYQFDKYQSNEAYWKTSKPYCKENCEEVKELSEGDITRKREADFALAKASESRSGAQTLLKSVLFIFFSFVAFAIHWKLAKKCRNE